MAIIGNRQAAGIPGPVVSGAYNATPPALSDGDVTAHQLDAEGNLFVDVANTATNPVRIDPTGTTVQPVSITSTASPVTTVKTIKAVSITAGTPVAVWTPASGKKFVLMGWSLGTGGTSASILLEDSSGVEFARTPAITIGANSPSSFQYISTAANNSLYLDVTATVTVSGFVFGYEE